MKRLFLIDAYALIFKYYYAFLGREMRNSEGFNTSVVFGFAKFVRELLSREKPDLIGVAFDPAGGSFRRELYPEYKANRGATPEDIILSVPYVKRFVEAMCIPVLEVVNYEADDVIGTLARKGEEAGYQVFMVTPDKDYGQLVTDNCVLYKQKGKDIEIVDREAIRAKYGIDNPLLVRDILAIGGDASDNIPGVDGIGDKGAMRLVQQWGDVESIIENIPNIKGKQSEKLANSREKLILSKELTTICVDVPIEFNESQLTMCQPNTELLRELYKEMNFRAFLSELSAPPAKPKRAAALEGQGDLFAAFEGVEQIVEEAEPEVESIVTTKHCYTLIESVDQLRELVALLRGVEEFCFDTETTGLDIFGSDIVGISFACKVGEAWYLPVGSFDRGEIVDILQPLFGDEKIAKIGHNLKFDILVLRQIGIEVKGRLIDTMIIHYLIDPESRHAMNLLALRYLNYQPIEIESLIGKGSKQLSMASVAVSKICDYAAEDADITLRLKEVLSPILAEQQLVDLYNSIEEPMIRVLVDIECEGVTVDSEALGRYGKVLNEELLLLERTIREEAEEPELNVNSSVQLGEVLFAKMKIADKPKMTKTKRYCTDEEYLQSFAGRYSIIDNILKYRGVKKLLSTYVETLPQLINKRSGRIHSSYNQAVTATGRLSSSNPNLQNIPIRDDLARPIRMAFVASDDEHLILSADYSQIELRVMAHISGDSSMIEAFKSGADIHAATAARLFGKEIDEVTSDERRKAKTANFGIIYGISPFGLSQRLDIPRYEAKEIIDGYFESYPAVKSYMDRVVEQARGSEYVETLFGRRRYLRDINSRSAVTRSFAERNAINAPIQGTAADIMKLAMIGIWREFMAQGIESRMIMQVHDEVVVDLVKGEEQRVRDIVTTQMERAAELLVPLDVDCGVGNNWLDAH
ncbi:MAG: DNA polymerase I [Rikenellaceae bacterium]